LPGVPDVPSADELAVLPAAELAARLSEAYRVIREMTVQAEQLTAQAETLSAQVGRLQARVEDLERRAGRDSSTSCFHPFPVRWPGFRRRPTGTQACPDPPPRQPEEPAMSRTAATKPTRQVGVRACPFLIRGRQDPAT
jgi:hypothetical protein